LVWANKKAVLSASLSDYFEANESLSAESIKNAEIDVKLTNLDGVMLTQGSTVALSF